MKNRNLFIVLLSILLPSSTGIHSQPLQSMGDWFSPLEKHGEGVSTYHLRLSSDGRFDLYRILLHPRLKWEEKRYSGRWIMDNKTYEFHPESCEVYTSLSLSSRRALLRKYDCDHLHLKFVDNKGQASLSPNEYGIGYVTEFFRPPLKGLGNSSQWEKSRWLRVFQGEGVYLAWGIGVKWMQSKRQGEIWNQERRLGVATILKSMETSLEFSSPEQTGMNTGDFFLYK